jgi:hypothetical protein
MAQFADIERLRQATSLQTELVLREVRLAEEAIRHGRVVANVENEPNARNVFRERPSATILPFVRDAHRRRG